MQKNTLIAFVAFVVTASTAYLLLKAPPKAQRTEKKKSPVVSFTKEDVSRIDVKVPGGDAYTVERKGDQWQLTKPVTYAAVKYAVNDMATKLGKLELGDVVTEQAKRHSEFGVDATQAISVTAFKGDKQLVSLLLGKFAAGFTMVRIGDDAKVYQAVGNLAPSFKRTVLALRNKQIVGLAADKIKHVVISSEGGTTALKRVSNAWKTTTGTSAKIDKYDPVQANRIIAGIAGMAARTFPKAMDDAAAGLDKPVAKAVITPLKGQTKTVLLGKRAGSLYYAKVKGEPQIFGIDANAAKLLSSRPIDFSSTRVVEIDPDAITAFTIHHRQDKGPVKKYTYKRTKTGWSLDGKTVLNSQRKPVDGVTLALKRMESMGFARRTPEALGLDKPRWRLVVQTRATKAKQAATYELKMGSKPNESGAIGLQVAGRPLTYLISSYQIRALTAERSAPKRPKAGPGRRPMPKAGTIQRVRPAPVRPGHQPPLRRR